MKKLLTVTAVLVLGLFLATPAMAGHSGRYRRHGNRVVRGTFLGINAIPVPHFPVPRFHSSFSLSVGVPAYGYPVYYQPAPSYYYAPRPVVIAEPPCERVWIPGHYAWDGGFRIYVQGHWSHRHAHDYDDEDDD